jgi:hypothetical protein
VQSTELDLRLSLHRPCPSFNVDTSTRVTAAFKAAAEAQAYPAEDPLNTKAFAASAAAAASKAALTAAPAGLQAADLSLQKRPPHRCLAAAVTHPLQDSAPPHAGPAPTAAAPPVEQGSRGLLCAAALHVLLLLLIWGLAREAVGCCAAV